MDNREPPWNDVHVRKAVAYCCDKRGIATGIMHGLAAPASTLPTPYEWASLGYTPAQVARLYKGLPDYRLSIANAKKELALSAYPRGFSHTCYVPSDSNPELTLMAESLAANLQQIGVHLAVTPVPQAEVQARWFSSKKNTGCTIIWNGPTFLDPADYARIMLLKAFDISGSYNSANYYNPKVEHYLAQSDLTSSPSRRAAAIINALKIAAQDCGYVPLVWAGGAMAISNKYNYVGFHPWAYLIQEWAERIVAA
jgi:peptide/nickel transport system substrate-binding protein